MTAEHVTIVNGLPCWLCPFWGKFIWSKCIIILEWCMFTIFQFCTQCLL